MEIKDVDVIEAEYVIELMKGYYAFYGVNPPPDPKIKSLILRLIDEPHRGKQYVGYINGNPCGFVTLYIVMSTLTCGEVVLMNDLYVSPEYRGKGLGKLLFDKAVEYTKNNGYPKLEWQTEPDNIIARAFYDRQGAKHANWVYYMIKPE